MENFRINSLEIIKTGVFEYLQIKFPTKKDLSKAEVHILTGENGTGKSTILEILTMILDEVPGRTTNWNILKFKVGDSQQNFNIHNKDILANYLANRRNDNREINYEFAVFAYSGYRKISNVKVVGPTKIEDSPLKDSINFNKSINPYNLIQWIVNTKTSELNNKGRGENAKAELYKKTLGILETVISDIINQSVLFDIDDNFDVLLIVNGLSLPFDVMPDGLKSMTLWLGDLLMRMDRIKWKDDLPIFDRNFILFLDEIEVHLHPAWQRKILPVVQKLFKNAQIFISTHSPFVVGSVDGAYVHKLKKDGAYAVLDGVPVLSEDAESYDTILEEVFGIKKRFGDIIEDLLTEFRAITREILKGNEDNIGRWNEIISIFENQERPDEIMSVIKPIRNQINRIRNQAEAIY